MLWCSFHYFHRWSVRQRWGWMGHGLPVGIAPRLRWLSYSVWPTVHSSSSALRWTRLALWPSCVCQPPPSPPPHFPVRTPWDTTLLIWWLCGWGRSVESECVCVCVTVSKTVACWVNINVYKKLNPSVSMDIYHLSSARAPVAQLVKAFRTPIFEFSIFSLTITMLTLFT